MTILFSDSVEWSYLLCYFPKYSFGYQGEEILICYHKIKCFKGFKCNKAHSIEEFNVWKALSDHGVYLQELIQSIAFPGRCYLLILLIYYLFFDRMCYQTWTNQHSTGLLTIQICIVFHFVLIQPHSYMIYSIRLLTMPQLGYDIHQLLKRSNRLDF